jgi:hypothetical protein
MRKLLTLLIVLSAVCSYGQNWKPVQPGNRYLYYLDGHGFDSTAVVLQADSMSVSGSDSIFFLNRVVRRISGPAADTRLTNQPQFLQREVTCFTDGSFRCEDTATLVFFPYAAINSTWVYDTAQNITATIVSASYQQVFSLNDSVKTISLSTGDTVVLSKNCGILQFPAAQGAHYRLAGITGQLLGIQVPGFFDIFYAIQPGDVLEYRITDGQNSYPTSGNYSARRWHKDSLLSKSFSSNHVILNFYRYRNDTVVGGFNAGIYTAPVTVSEHYYNDSLLGYDMSVNQGLTRGTGPYFYTAPQLLSYDTSSVFGCRTLVRQSRYRVDDTTYGDDTAIFNTHYVGNGPYGYTGVVNHGVYGAGIGMMYYQHSEYGTAFGFYQEHELIYARINGIEYGTEVPVGINDDNASSPMRIYPNPAENVVHYPLTPHAVQLRVTDSYGRLCISATSDGSGILDISSLAPGIYFISIDGAPPQQLIRK